MKSAVIAQTELYALYIGLFVMMIGVALEVTQKDWRQCIANPLVFIAALSLQIFAIPLLAILFVRYFPMHSEVAIGILLISLCPGGVMSNFFSLRSNGNTAFSSMLTLCSSLLVAFTFPVGMYLYSQINTNLNTLIASDSLRQISYLTATLTIPPLIIGLLLKKYNPTLATHLRTPLKVFSITLVTAVIVMALISNRSLIAKELWTVFPAAFIFNGILLITGYGFGWRLKLPTNLCRTIAIELGIQNATVAIILIPHLMPDRTGVFNMVAFWGLWHLISGLIISTYWKRKIPHSAP